MLRGMPQPIPEPPGKPPGAAPALCADADLRERLRRRLAAVEVQALPVAGRRHAAVAVTVVQAGHGADVAGLPTWRGWCEDAALLLTRRAETLRSHAGQWALPGGRIDAGESAEQAALRELAEEVGLVLPPQDILGRLDDYATRSGYVITPVVVWGGAARAMRPEPAEVASVHRIPLAELLRPDAPLLNTVKGTRQTVLRMPMGERWIAAPTAAILYQFREWALLDRPTRVAHFDQPAFAWR